MNVIYENDGRLAIFDGYKFRKDMKTGYYLSTRKTDCGHHERLHRYVWRYHNGEIPEGYHVHHIDEDKGHNEIWNLACIDGRKHESLHGTKRAELHYDEMLENLEKNVRPAAAKWHGSDAGIEWHRKHGVEVAENLEPRKFVCEHCGKEFYKKPLGQIKYCSNACRAAARRKSGVDDEERTCIICGKRYTSNRYAKGKTCSPTCRNIYVWRTSRRPAYGASGANTDQS